MTSRGSPTVKAAVVVLFKKPLRVIEFMAGDYRDGNDCASTGVIALPFLGSLVPLPVALHVCSGAESTETQLLSVSVSQPRKKLERRWVTTLKCCRI